MIPLIKLSKLPRLQKLRKTAKILGEAEYRLGFSGCLPSDEMKYLGNLVGSLASDNAFSSSVKDALVKAQGCLFSDGTDKKEIRRALNSVYRLLLAETGHYPSDWDFIEPSGALDPAKRRPFPGMQVYLEDIRSPFNVGSMFRAAESFGAEMIWLSPLCADPRHKRAERTAMGCVDVLPWERLASDPFAGQAEGRLDGSALIMDSAQAFFTGSFFALETGGIPLPEFPFPSRGILIAGSEELGVSPGALAAADASFGRVTIPSYGAKGSLNVSVAFGIVMQAWAAQLSRL